MTDKIGHLSTNDLRKIAGSRGKDPHPHVQSVLMATFILLGEREQELWVGTRFRDRFSFFALFPVLLQCHL